MKYIDEYRDLGLARRLSQAIRESAGSDSRSYAFMEVCGTHTDTFFRFGLKDLLPRNVRLISGPGCPVCVTDTPYIDNALSMAASENVIMTTFGDMMKVPGSSSSLYKERAKGRDIRAVYSVLEALNIAEKNPKRHVIFLGVGFETTAPTIGMAILEARKRKMKNFSVYSGHKLIPPALKHLLKDPGIKIDGFILPAHVSAIIGARAYGFLKRSKVPCVIAGFEPLDMLQGIAMLLHQIRCGRADVEVQYNRVVRKEGNRKAQRILERLFIVCDSAWRGLGDIPKSGLRIKKEFEDFDAERRFKIKKPAPAEEEKYCICGDVLKGKNKPTDCTLFAKVCTPENPKGPCMVSSEGSCSVYYRYGR